MSDLISERCNALVDRINDECKFTLTPLQKTGIFRVLSKEGGPMNIKRIVFYFLNEASIEKWIEETANKLYFKVTDCQLQEYAPCIDFIRKIVEEIQGEK